jgi:ferredoxin
MITARIVINDRLCTGCGRCHDTWPTLDGFLMNTGGFLREPEINKYAAEIEAVITDCPAQAITLEHVPIPATAPIFEIPRLQQIL